MGAACFEPTRQFYGFRPLAYLRSTMAAPAAIVGIVGAPVLLGKDVFNVEGGRWRGEVGEVTILAPTTGPFADKLAKGPCHQTVAVRLRSDRAFACRMAMKSMVWT
jgi:hypothetical protein